jgi:signal transduction histidine kinase
VFVSGEPVKAFYWELMDKNGKKMNAEASVSLLKDSRDNVIGFKGIVRDITQRIEAEKERDRYELRLAQAQKMEAIGTLAGGIAHDFNNMLSAIMGYTELARSSTPENSQARNCLDQVIKAGIRARDLISQILSFSRKYDVKRQPVDIGLILGEALNLIRASIPTSVDIQCSIDSEPAFVFADPIEIHQIIMNLCTNAYQAMEEKGGHIQIDLEQVFLEEDEAAAIHPQLRGGNYLKLKIADTGSGMDSETIKYIFDPFFTTKERNKGTGLGLATVQRIVTELKGGISVESTPGRGSAFILFFPKHG